ncbi:hypothetical protein GCM10027418_30650 [Mariniluteicoccus endophyticus]
MARVTLHVRTRRSPEDALARLTDLALHERFVPLTRIDRSGPLEIGTRFTARTALGPVGFDDVMVVRALGPTHARFDKVGRFITGGTTIDVRPGPPTVVEWTQELGVRGIPAALDPAVGLVVRAAYGAMVRVLLR